MLSVIQAVYIQKIALCTTFWFFFYLPSLPSWLSLGHGCHNPILSFCEIRHFRFHIWGDYTVFVFLSLAYFAWHNNLGFIQVAYDRILCFFWKNGILLIHVPHFLHLFTSSWSFSLIVHHSCCESCWNKHRGSNVCLLCKFYFFGVSLSSEITIICFSISSNHSVIFHNGM